MTPVMTGASPSLPSSLGRINKVKRYKVKYSWIQNRIAKQFYSIIIEFID